MPTLTLPEAFHHRTDIVDRPHLRSLFGGRSIIHVMAPAGYGKTVAVFQWLSTRQDTDLWWGHRWHATGASPHHLAEFPLDLSTNIPATYDIHGLVESGDTLGQAGQTVIVLDDLHTSPADQVCHLVCGPSGGLRPVPPYAAWCWSAAYLCRLPTPSWPVG